MTNRRKALVGATLAAAGLALWRTGAYQALLPAPKFDFTDLADPKGFRTFQAGQVTLGSIPFIGLDNAAPPGLAQADALVRNDLCGALFDTEPKAQSTVQVAYFYDYRCGICKTLSPRLRELDDIQLTSHDVANIAPDSEIAARASIAAANQGAFEAVHARLMRAALQPNQAYIRAIAESIGLDPDRLIHDMADPDVDRQIWLARALANRFGMAGTPGLVIGRTVAKGNIDDRALRELVKLERARGPVCC